MFMQVFRCLFYKVLREVIPLSTVNKLFCSATWRGRHPIPSKNWFPFIYRTRWLCNAENWNCNVCARVRALCLWSKLN